MIGDHLLGARGNWLSGIFDKAIVSVYPSKLGPVLAMAGRTLLH